MGLHSTHALLSEVLASVVEALDETVADAVGGALEAVELGEVQPRAAQRVPETYCYKTAQAIQSILLQNCTGYSKTGGRGVLDVLHDVGLQRLLVVAEVLLHQAPQEMVALFFFC